ncbi:MAG: TIGR01906 family membrane protein [Chloroflexota bacterium]|nr:TIGR01906 family membrane protein [Chloroflexota bacterium]
MKAPHWLIASVQTLLSLSVPIILIVSPLYLFFTPAMVRHEYRGARFPSSSRFDGQERLRLSDAIIRYLRGRESVEALQRLRTDEGEKALRESEIEHLVDVKGVLDGLFLIHGVGLAIGLLTAVVFLRWAQGGLLTEALRRGIWLTVGLMALALVASLVDFDIFFTRFHQIFFRPGTWVFYVQDTLIQLYPLRFWIDVVWKLSVFILAEAGLLYALLAVLAGRVLHVYS